MTANDNALMALKLQALDAIRAAGTARTETTVAEFLAKFNSGKRTRGELERVCKWYINLSKGVKP
jgi:hypothetical protein